MFNPLGVRDCWTRGISRWGKTHEYFRSCDCRGFLTDAVEGLCWLECRKPLVTSETFILRMLEVWWRIQRFRVEGFHQGPDVSRLTVSETFNFRASFRPGLEVGKDGTGTDVHLSLIVGTPLGPSRGVMTGPHHSGATPLTGLGVTDTRSVLGTLHNVKIGKCLLSPSLPHTSNLSFNFPHPSCKPPHL